MKEPRSIEHEQAVLAGMMNNSTCFYEAMAIIDEDYFYDSSTRRVYEMIVGLKTTSNPSANMLIKSTQNAKEKSAIKLFDGKWTNVDEFFYSLKSLKDTYYKRQLYHTLMKTANRFDDADYEDLIASIDKELAQFMFDDDGENIIDPEERAPQALSEYHDKRANPERAKGIPYSVVNDNGRAIGFPSLDRALNGAHGGDLVMLAAKTGEGKTAFALNLARLFSFNMNYRGYYLNTEMRLDEMEARLLAPLAGVNANEIMYGRLEGTQQEIKAKDERITDAYNQYMKSQLLMSRVPDLSLHKAKGLAKQVRGRYKKLDYMIVDYVGRMNVKGFERQSWDELYEITKQMKELAMILNIPIFILAQRNQAGEVEGAKKMMNECDGVLFFEPIVEEDNSIIERKMPSRSNLVNYKVVKKKVRRDDNPDPLYISFDKKRNFINEVV